MGGKFWRINYLEEKVRGKDGAKPFVYDSNDQSITFNPPWSVRRYIYILGWFTLILQIDSQNKGPFNNYVEKIRGKGQKNV